MGSLVDLSGHCKDSSNISVWHKIQSSQLVLVAGYGCLDVAGWLRCTRVCRFAMISDTEHTSTCSPVFPRCSLHQNSFLPPASSGYKVDVENTDLFDERGPKRNRHQ